MNDPAQLGDSIAASASTSAHTSRAFQYADLSLPPFDLLDDEGDVDVEEDDDEEERDDGTDGSDGLGGVDAEQMNDDAALEDGSDGRRRDSSATDALTSISRRGRGDRMRGAARQPLRFVFRAPRAERRATTLNENGLVGRGVRGRHSSSFAEDDAVSSVLPDGDDESDDGSGHRSAVSAARLFQRAAAHAQRTARVESSTEGNVGVAALSGSPVSEANQAAGSIPGGGDVHHVSASTQGRHHHHNKTGWQQAGRHVVVEVLAQRSPPRRPSPSQTRAQAPRELPAEEAPAPPLSPRTLLAAALAQARAGLGAPVAACATAPSLHSPHSVVRTEIMSMVADGELHRPDVVPARVMSLTHPHLMSTLHPRTHEARAAPPRAIGERRAPFDVDGSNAHAGAVLGRAGVHGHVERAHSADGEDEIAGNYIAGSALVGAEAACMHPTRAPAQWLQAGAAPAPCPPIDGPAMQADIAGSSRTGHAAALSQANIFAAALSRMASFQPENVHVDLLLVADRHAVEMGPLQSSIAITMGAAAHILQQQVAAGSAEDWGDAASAGQRTPHTARGQWEWTVVDAAVAAGHAQYIVPPSARQAAHASGYRSARCGLSVAHYDPVDASLTYIEFSVEATGDVPVDHTAAFLAAVGLAPRTTPLEGVIGSFPHSIGLCNLGHLVCGGLWSVLQPLGASADWRTASGVFARPPAEFRVGDTVGMLVRWMPASGPWACSPGTCGSLHQKGDGQPPPYEAVHVTFSVNGRVAGIAGPMVIPRGTELYPIVTIGSAGTRIRARSTAADVVHGARNKLLIAHDDTAGRATMPCGHGPLSPSTFLAGSRGHAVFALDGSVLLMHDD